jgi:hypothetical protein
VTLLLELRHRGPSAAVQQLQQLQRGWQQQGGVVVVLLLMPGA